MEVDMVNNDNISEDKYCDYEQCKRCGGACCKRCGCFFSPRDFQDLSFDGLKREFDKGYITIEIVDGEVAYLNGFSYVVRMRNVDGPIYEDRIWDRPLGNCILLTETGCKLDFAHRPTGGKMLIPDITSKSGCHSEYDTYSTVREWLPYKATLYKLANYYSG